MCNLYSMVRKGIPLALAALIALSGCGDIHPGVLPYPRSSVTGEALSYA